MVSLAAVSPFRSELLDHVDATAGAGEGGNRGLEVAFLRSGLAQLSSGKRLLVVQAEVVVALPEAILAGFVRFAEISLWFQVFRWICRLPSEEVCTGTYLF